MKIKSLRPFSRVADGVAETLAWALYRPSFAQMIPWLASSMATDIDRRISLEMGGRLERFQVHSRELPGYRFVDLYRAVEHYCQSWRAVTKLESEHEEENLNSLLHGKRSRWTTWMDSGHTKT